MIHSIQAWYSFHIFINILFLLFIFFLFREFRITLDFDSLDKNEEKKKKSYYNKYLEEMMKKKRTGPQFIWKRMMKWLEYWKKQKFTLKINRFDGSTVSFVHSFFSAFGLLIWLESPHWDFVLHVVRFRNLFFSGHPTRSTNKLKSFTWILELGFNCNTLKV